MWNFAPKLLPCWRNARGSSLRFRFQSPVKASEKYRADIDGLRALAILPVVFYHAKIAPFSGGFVGVDIFFVISGYLITSIIAKDISRGQFSFVTFYERRMRRIFPALFAVVLFCILIGGVLLIPKDLSSFGRSLIAMAFFVSNIFFRRGAPSDGYFDSSSEKQALLHTWSLSVEEQFYLFFPVMLVLLTRWTKNRSTVWLSIGALVSFAISVWAVQYKPLGAFYLLIPRAWELLVGSLLALKAVPPLNSRHLREIAGLTGLGLIGYAVFLFSKETDFPGINALFPCLGAALIIYSGESGPTFVRAILSLRGVVFIGVISYSLYLWHWPIIVFSRYFSTGRTLTDAEQLLVVITSLGLAFFSFEFIESPFRGNGSAFIRKQIFALGFAASIFTILVGLTISATEGLPGRYDQAAIELVSKNLAEKDDYQNVCTNYKKEIYGIADIEFCPVGTEASKKIMFWGDSHVQQLYPLIRKLHANGALRGHDALFTIDVGCPLVEHMNVERKGYHCDSFAHFAMMRALEDDVDTVFMGFSTWWTLPNIDRGLYPSADGKRVGTISRDEQLRRLLQELSDHIHTLKAHGKRVIVSLPFPLFDKSIPELEMRNAMLARWGLDGVAQDETLPAFREEIMSIAKREGAEVFDPRKSLCPREQCITQFNGVSIYKDNSHVTTSNIGLLEEDIRQTLLVAHYFAF